MRPGDQREMFDPTLMYRARLSLRAVQTYDALLVRLSKLERPCCGRLEGLRRMSTPRAIFEFSLDKKSIPALERAGAVRWEGDDLVVVGWMDSRFGKEDAFRKRQAELSKLAHAARWGHAVRDRVPAREGERVLAPKPAQLLMPNDAPRAGHAPLEDLSSRARSALGSADPTEQSSSGEHVHVDRPERKVVGPAPAAPPARLAPRAEPSPRQPEAASNRTGPRGRAASIEPAPPPPGGFKAWQQHQHQGA